MSEGKTEKSESTCIVGGLTQLWAVFRVFITVHQYPILRIKQSKFRIKQYIVNTVALKHSK